MADNQEVESNDNTEKVSFLGRMMTKSMTRKNGTNSKSKTTKTKTKTMTPPKRRVVKAMPRVSSTDNVNNDTTAAAATTTTLAVEDPQDNQNNKEDDDTLLDKDYATKTPTNKLPTDVQSEVQREKTEQWRQQRIDATAAIRKENKEKEVMEHRRKISVGEQGEASTSTSTSNTTEPVPDILSVKPKFPEHKRKASQDDHDDVGKKTKVEDYSDDDNDNNDDDDDDSAKNKGNSWMTMMGVGVVAATAVIIAIKIMRKR